MREQIEELKGLGFNVKQVAHLAGVSYMTLHRYMKQSEGWRNLTQQEIAELERVYFHLKGVSK